MIKVDRVIVRLDRKRSGFCVTECLLRRSVNKVECAGWTPSKIMRTIHDGVWMEEDAIEGLLFCCGRKRTVGRADTAVRASAFPVQLLRPNGPGWQ